MHPKDFFFVVYMNRVVSSNIINVCNLHASESYIFTFKRSCTALHQLKAKTTKLYTL